MILSNIRDFVSLLRAENELVEISAQVDPDLELAEIHRSVIAANGPALLFTNVRGSAFPVVTNLFGTSKRVELSFGSGPKELIDQVSKLPEDCLPPNLSKLWSNRSLFTKFLKIGIRRNRSGAVNEVVQTPPQLSQLPLIKSWLEDGGSFVTLPLVYTEHPVSGIHNLGMYRIQRFDDSTTGLHMQIGKGGGFHLAAATELGQELPVNINIGGPPAAILAAVAPLPENVPELIFASLVMGSKIGLSSNPLGPLPLISEAEFCLVGKVLPNEVHAEGPFGDHYGYYSLKHDYPLFRCSGVTRRRNPILPATIVGKPRQEDFYIGDYLQVALAPLIKLVMPTVTDIWSYGETGYHSLAAAVVRQRFKREALTSVFRILGEGQLSLTKFLLVVDRPQDLRNFKEVLTYILERADFRNDLYVFSSLAMDSLDYTGPRINEGSKGALIGVGQPIRNLPGEFHGNPPGVVNEVGVFCPGCLVVSGPDYLSDPKFSETLGSFEQFSEWPLVILVDDVKRTIKSTLNFLWTTFTRFEPGADIHASSRQLIRNQVAYNPPIVIDARIKPWYPKELFCDPETKATVKRRWSEYFPEGMQMGDSDFASLD